MLPFMVQFKPGQPVYEQVVYAVRKAVVTGRLKPGDAFPSVRRLSKELKINPNTAHKVVSALRREGLLVVEPGRGTFINRDRPPDSAGRAALLGGTVEALVVEAKKLELDLGDVITAIEQTWEQL